MSEPKAGERSVSTDALSTLGTIHQRQEKRDAIHIAVEPVAAGERLQPGEHIRVESGVATSGEPHECLGIVDPFLRGPVRKGERFWFLMYPRAVHSLRHVWTHPAFPDEEGTPAVARQPTRAEDLAWIERHAAHLGMTYQELMARAKDWVENEEMFIQQGSESMRGDFDKEEFWPRYERLTLSKVRSPENFFGCNC